MARRHLLLLLPLLALAFSVAVASAEAISMSLDEVSAAVSVLLGFAPPAMLPSQSSAKLNKVLLPNPFDRPRAVFLMQIDESHGEYGSAEIVKQGAEVVRTALTKALDQLQAAYNGKIVGLVISTNEASTSLTSIIDAPSSLHISRRLAEASRTNASASASIAAIILVRLSLAWTTGIILLISTLIGICLLMNMPLTRDTLMYSNVKLD